MDKSVHGQESGTTPPDVAATLLSLSKSVEDLSRKVDDVRYTLAQHIAEHPATASSPVPSIEEENANKPVNKLTTETPPEPVRSGSESNVPLAIQRALEEIKRTEVLQAEAIGTRIIMDPHVMMYYAYAKSELDLPRGYRIDDFIRDCVVNYFRHFGVELGFILKMMKKEEAEAD